MSALSNYLDMLLHWLESIGLHPPSQDVRLVEVSLGDGTYHVRRDELRKPLDYGARFEELLRIGYPWCPTRVNLSGPARTVLDHQWHVDSVLTIE